MMVSPSQDCKLCFDNLVDENVQIINKSIQDMLQTVLTNFDLTTTEGQVICKTCHGKLEKNYCFKKKCVFTEDTIRPFVIKNIKMNLNEIRNQIIRSEGAETEKNVCRLCLQYTDDDMTLTKDEKQQFEVLFPEVNLNLTNFVTLCLSCYNTLQKYCIFVTSCSRSEDCQEWSSNREDVDEKKTVVLCTKEVKMKSEEDLSELSCSSFVDCSMKQISGIKSEETRLCSNNSEGDDDKQGILHEEVDIKSDDESMDTGCSYLNPDNLNTSFKQEGKDVQIKNRRLISRHLEESDSNIYFGMFPTEGCSSLMEDTIDAKHTKIKKYKCEECGFENNTKADLKSHIIYWHSESSTNALHECDKCDVICKSYLNLQNHMLVKHSDLSKIHMFQCAECDYTTKRKANLKTHVAYRHTNPKIQTYKCEKCNYKSTFIATLKRHIFNNHTNFPKTKIYTCDICDYKCKYSVNLKTHVTVMHTNPGRTQIYKCQECDYQCHFKEYLSAHIQYRHNDTSKIKIYICVICDQKFKHPRSLKRHIANMHADPSEIQIHECGECNFKTKYKESLRAHIQHRHTDPPINWNLQMWHI